MSKLEMVEMYQEWLDENLELKNQGHRSIELDIEIEMLENFLERLNALE